RRHGKPRSPQTCPQTLSVDFGKSRRWSSLDLGRSCKGSPQPRIFDACQVLVEHGCPFRTSGSGYCLADLVGCPAKETWARWPPPLPDRVDFIGHRQCGRFVLCIARDGETQQQQKPFANSLTPPILRNEWLHGSQATLGIALMSERCAKTAEPCSRTVPASTINPCFFSMARSFRLAAGSWGSTQTTSPPAGLKKSKSQSSVVSSALIERSRQSTSA